jgi:hypothetical protein
MFENFHIFKQFEERKYFKERICKFLFIFIFFFFYKNENQWPKSPASQGFGADRPARRERGLREIERGREREREFGSEWVGSVGSSELITSTLSDTWVVLDRCLPIS